MTIRLLLACILIGVTCHAQEYYVSPLGNDENDGSRSRPFKTLLKASSVAQVGDTCYLGKGVYRETLKPKHSGKPGNPIVFTNVKGEVPVISGADILDNGKKVEGNIYAVPMPWNLNEDNLFFANGEMLMEASWPNPGQEPLFKPIRGKASGGSETTLKCPELPGGKDAWKGAELVCAGGAAWVCWTNEITAYDNTSKTLTFKTPKKGFYKASKGNLFQLRGVRYALDAPGEWFYDTAKKQLLLVPPAKSGLVIEAKRRQEVIDLSSRSHIEVSGIQFRAGSIKTDNDSTHITLKNLQGTFGSVLINGSNNLVLGCDIGYNARSVLTLRGRDNRVINNYLHHGGYAGWWGGTVVISGRRQVFSHNTVRHSGRDLIGMSGLMESIVQYNDVSDAGWLTKDLGMFYGHNTDFANTVFRYNRVHDNRAQHSSMGIYFDHLSHNAIVHNNVVWNVSTVPIRFNNPSYGDLIFNNSCWNSGRLKTFDHSKRDDLFGVRYFNNIFPKGKKLPNTVVWENNLEPDGKSSPYRNAEDLDFRLKDSKERIGAYAGMAKPWKAGWSKTPPNPLPVYKASEVPWMNRVRNACFEFGSTEAWEKTNAQKAELAPGNGWGNGTGLPDKKSTSTYTKENPCPTGTSKQELRLGPGRDGIKQMIKGLSPNTNYTLTAWLRVSDAGEKISLGVKDHGAEKAEVGCSAVEWTRKSISFKTGPTANSATIYALKTSNGNGHAYADNFLLPATPAGK